MHVDMPGHMDEPSLDIDEQRRLAAGQRRINETIEKIRDNAVTSVNFASPLTHEHLTKDNLRDLAAALEVNTSVTSIHFNNNPLDDECIKIIAPALGKHPAVQLIYFADNGFGDEGAAALAEHLTGHPSLHELVINGTAPMTGKGFTELGTLLEANPMLCGMAFGADGTEIINRAEDGLVAMSESAMRAKNPNLITLWPVRGDAEAFVRRNKEITKSLMGALASPIDELSCMTQLRAVIRLPALSYYAFDEGTTAQQQQVAAFKAHLDTLPEPSLDGDLSWETLTTPDATGLAPLDNPKMAARFPEIAAALESRGTPITADQLMQTNRDGDPYLTVAIVTETQPKILEELFAQGHRLSADDLVTNDGNPNALLDTILLECPQELFREVAWIDQPISQYRRVVGSLSQEEKDNAIPNHHSLSAAISRQQRSMQIG